MSSRANASELLKNQHIDIFKTKEVDTQMKYGFVWNKCYLVSARNLTYDL